MRKNPAIRMGSSPVMPSSLFVHSSGLFDFFGRFEIVVLVGLFCTNRIAVKNWVGKQIGDIAKIQDDKKNLPNSSLKRVPRDDLLEINAAGALQVRQSIA